jgi:16S rRNA processing protein RimM
MSPDDAPRTATPGARVDLAKVVRPHGVRGALKVLLHNPDTTLLRPGRSFELGARSVNVTGVKPLSDPRFRVIEIEGLSDRDEAERLRGQALTVARDALPALDEGEYYHVDLIGARVETPEGVPLGHVVRVMQSSVDVLEILTPEGGELLIPIVDDFVKTIASVPSQTDQGRIIAIPPEWD